MQQHEPMRLELDGVYMGEVTNGVEYRAALDALTDCIEATLIGIVGEDPTGEALVAATKIVWSSRPHEVL